MQPERRFRGQDQAGVRVKYLRPSGETAKTGIGIKAINPRGLGTESPEKIVSLRFSRIVLSAHSQFRFFRPIHVSAFNFRMSLFR